MLMLGKSTLIHAYAIHTKWPSVSSDANIDTWKWVPDQFPSISATVKTDADIQCELSLKLVWKLILMMYDMFILLYRPINNSFYNSLNINLH